MDELITTLKKRPIVYVTRDIERALGFSPEGGYFVISNRTAYAEEVRIRHPNNVWLIERSAGRMLDTHELLSLPEVAAVISKHNAQVLVFKNTSMIEKLCAEKGWNLLNPQALLSETIENKITQVAWLGELQKFLPAHHITTGKDCVWNGTPFIVQYAHAHTGEGTMLVNNNETAENIRKTFPHREIRVTDFIDGPVFTSNNIVTEQEVLPGNISYQITGIPPFTDNKFSTIGNDWGYATTALSSTQKNDISIMVQDIGKKMRNDGWKGLFGVDVILDSATGKVYLLEINARQPASTTFESQLQKKTNPSGLSVFEAHLASLLKLTNLQTYKLTTVSDGSQIIQRVTKRPLDVKRAAYELRQTGFSVIEYENKAYNTDALRIQSDHSLIQHHGILNDTGKRAVQCLEQSWKQTP